MNVDFFAGVEVVEAVASVEVSEIEVVVGAVNASGKLNSPE